MLTDIEKNAVLELTKYRLAFDLLYPDTKYRYCMDDKKIILSCLMDDKFITKCDGNTFVETIGSVVIFDKETSNVEVIHNVTINTWVNKYIKNCKFIQNIDLNIALIDEI